MLKKINLDVKKMLDDILLQGFQLLIQKKVLQVTDDGVLYKNEFLSLYSKNNLYFFHTNDGGNIEKLQGVELCAQELGVLFLKQDNTWKKFNLQGGLIDKNEYDFLVTAYFQQTGYIKTKQNGVDKLISGLGVVKHEAKNFDICFDEKLGKFYHYDPNFPKEKDYIPNEIKNATKNYLFGQTELSR